MIQNIFHCKKLLSVIILDMNEIKLGDILILILVLDHLDLIYLTSGPVLSKIVMCMSLSSNEIKGKSSTRMTNDVTM